MRQFLGLFVVVVCDWIGTDSSDIINRRQKNKINNIMDIKESKSYCMNRTYWYKIPRMWKKNIKKWDDKMEFNNEREKKK